jgi:hypothetical protein
VEVNFRIRWNGVVHDNIEIVEWNATSRDIRENEASDLFLLDLLDRLTELNLRNVSNQLKGGNATLL